MYDDVCKIGMLSRFEGSKSRRKRTGSPGDVAVIFPMPSRSFLRGTVSDRDDYMILNQAI